MRIIGVAAAALALAGCDMATVTPGVDLCMAPSYAPFVGRPVSALNGMVLPQPVRVIRPGDAVTEDFSPARLNIRLDGADRIAGVDCG